MNPIFDRIKAHCDKEYAPLDTSKGDGILYVGGGKYWPGIVVGCKMLRLIGSKLPIEVWYRDGIEKVKPKEVEGLGVTFHPIKDPIVMHRKYGGWVAKLEALRHTTLNRLLYLDADAYCVNDPLYLIENNPTGFQFWQDLPKQSTSIKWDQIWPDCPKTVPPVQGGQLFIDRSMTSQLINVCRYMCRNHELYFKLMYGDQDTWRVALNFQVNDYEFINPAVYVRNSFICSYDKKPIVVHRVNSKLFFVNDIPYGKSSYNTFNEKLPREKDVFQFFSELTDDRQSQASKVFSAIVNNRLWGQGCGGGSYGNDALDNANAIDVVIKKNKLRRVIDAGCGDMNVGKRIKAGQYVPLDVVPRPGIMVMDITEVDNLPSGDLLLSKDTIQHWPNEIVHKWLNDLIASNKYKAILIITDETEEDIRDTILGGYRPLRLGEYPLNVKGFTKVNKVRQKAYYLWQIGFVDRS